MSPEREAAKQLMTHLRVLVAAIDKTRRASDSRRGLPAGSSRARVTTANARWRTACEAEERARRAAVVAIADLVAEMGLPVVHDELRARVDLFGGES